MIQPTQTKEHNTKTGEQNNILVEADPELFDILQQEQTLQKDKLYMIAS